MESLQQEVFVPLQINLKKGQKAYYSKPDDKNAVTPLSKILVKAYILQKRLIENPGLNQTKFCKLNKISPRYFRAIMQFNFLSPKLKKRIMEGWMPKNVSTQQILTNKIPLSWKEQEEIFS
jgi:hypothetical protein